MKANKQIKQKIISFNGLVIRSYYINGDQINQKSNTVKMWKNLHGEIIFAGQA